VNRIVPTKDRVNGAETKDRVNRMSKKKKFSADEIAKARKPTTGMLRPRPKKGKKPRQKTGGTQREIKCLRCTRTTKLRGRIGRTYYYKCPNCGWTQEGKI